MQQERRLVAYRDGLAHQPKPPPLDLDSKQQGISTPVSLPTEPVTVLAQEGIMQDAPSPT